MLCVHVYIPILVSINIYLNTPDGVIAFKRQLSRYYYETISYNMAKPVLTMSQDTLFYVLHHIEYPRSFP